MRHLSDLRYRRVLDAGGDALGRLADLAIVPDGPIPAVRWAILATGDGERAIPWAEVAIEPAHMRLRRRLEAVPAEEPPAAAVRLGRDVLDLEGRDASSGRAFRVTDVHLEETGGQLRVIGVETGWRGLWRRIGIEPVAAALAAGRLRRNVVPWERVERPQAQAG